MKVIFCKTPNKLNEKIFNSFLKKISIEKRELILKNRDTLSAHTKLLSYVCARFMLSNELRTENRELQFIEDKNGKPRLAENEIFFNLSHTFGAFVFCFGREEVGIDIEKEREISEKIKDKFYSSDEKEQEPLLVWTKKEAITKLSGEGIKALSKADTQSSDIFFFSKKVDGFTISAASKNKTNIRFVNLSENDVIEKGCLLGEI